jgi:hypothetical protein
MKLSDLRHGSISVVVLYDLVDLREDVRLDAFRESEAWSVVAAVRDGPIILDDAEHKQRATVSAVQLDYTDGNDSPFEKRECSGLSSVLEALPPLSTKSITVGLHIRGDVAEEASATAVVINAFMKDEHTISEKLGGDLLSAAVWLNYGSGDEHWGLQITPSQQTQRGIGIRMEYSKDVSIKDVERLRVEINDMRAAAVASLSRALENLR